jgi:hypothetical protein
MARPLVSDPLWHAVEPLLPKGQRRRRLFGPKADRRSRGADGDHLCVVEGIP